MLLRFILLFFFYFYFSPLLHSFQFKYDVKKGETYHLFSASLQKLAQNTLSNSVNFEQAYEALLRVGNVDQQGTAEFSGEHRYSAKPFGFNKAYKLNDSQVYHSHFKRSPYGNVEIIQQGSYYPTVRGVPTFLHREVVPGEQWSGIGLEVQDFRKIHYNGPFFVPFNSNYQYINDITLPQKKLDEMYEQYQHYHFDIHSEMGRLSQLSNSQKNNTHLTGKDIALVLVKYYVKYKDQDYRMQTQKISQQGAVPVAKANGHYYGIIFWDKVNQHEVFSIGEYDFVYQWQNGIVRHWSGKEYSKVAVMNNDEDKDKLLEEEAKKEFQSDDNIEVEKQSEGLKITFGDLLFKFNRTNLRKEVVSSLNKVVKILKEHPNTILRIEGYSDDIGTAKVKQKISEGRAAAVANFLIQHHIDSSRVTYIGKSDSNPRVPNDSSTHRRMNRRVELHIITR